MSGYGNPTGGGNGGYSDGNCVDIFVQTTLASPNPEVIGMLKPNDILSLQLEREIGPLLAITPQNEIAGSITSSMLAKLIRCITEGFKFIAIVKSVTGGRCDIEIRPGN